MAQKALFFKGLNRGKHLSSFSRQKMIQASKGPPRQFFRTLSQCCRSGMFNPDPGSEFFLSGSRIRIKVFKYFNTKKMVFKLSEI